ncbi:hypothetical protein VCV18_009697 [Metarhizium anisopliae]
MTTDAAMRASLHPSMATGTKARNGHRLEVQKNTALMHKVLERGPHVPGAGQSHNKVEEDDVDDEGCSMLPFGCFLFWKYPHVGQGKAGSSANKRCTNKRNRPSRCRGGGHVE